MSDFLLELASEEIPARMQAAAAEQLRTRFVEGCKAAGLVHGDVIADASPRRLWLIARDIAGASAATREERKGPAATAPEAAIAGFLRSTGLSRDQLEERQTPKGVVLFAHIDTPGRNADAILGELVPTIVRDFQWPKSMRWGAASASAGAPRWVRPLTGIIALLGDNVVPCEALGVTAGRETRGHRIHALQPLRIDSASSYAAQLHAAHVIVASADRRAAIAEGAAAVAAAAGLSVIPDAGLVAENAGLTEWPVPILGRFDPAFLAVPREVIQLTMRTNQKYFALLPSSSGEGPGVGSADAQTLAPAFICVANLVASDGGTAIVAGNERVLSARLSDAKFFWDQDLATVAGKGLEGFKPLQDKLDNIVFHEKLGTVADKVERVAKLARWLVENALLLLQGGGDSRASAAGGGGSRVAAGDDPHPLGFRRVASPLEGEEARAKLATLAEQAARLCKADLVSATVGEFPEVQGIAGAYLARAAGLDPQIADAIRDHYKPVGQGDDVPTAPVSVAVALADKLDILAVFFFEKIRPTGSSDPFALRRAALSVLRILISNELRLQISVPFMKSSALLAGRSRGQVAGNRVTSIVDAMLAAKVDIPEGTVNASTAEIFGQQIDEKTQTELLAQANESLTALLGFFADRLKVQQREAGVRHDLIDAVFALGGEDDLVRLLARVRALQAVLATEDGTNLLAGVKRAANILRIEEAKDAAVFDAATDPALFSEAAETALGQALDAAVPAISAAVAAEDFAAAMAALAGLRPAVDAFFDGVIVNATDPAVRLNRLGLLARLRGAANSVADFSKVEG